LGGNHVSYLVGATWGPSEGNMTDSPLVRRARIYNFALVFAEGEKSDWYRPNNGEKKVLSCLKDANNTFLQLSSTKWFIYGFSMGGVGAITITVRNPNLFNGLFSGGGMPDLTNDVWIGYYNKTWQSNELIKTASPRQHLEVFFNRTIFLTCGFGDPIVVNYDNFSRILDNHNIRHYYGRVKGGHTYQMLLDTMNQTFIMFSHDVTGTLDDFFEGYSSPLTSTKISSTSNLDFIIPIISLIFLTIRFFDRRKNFLLLLELQDTPEFFFITS
ncbi:MAG: alpha/beta hydrolase-fold protein, partial [Candidatus Hodarchaeota archaeon]